MTPLAHVWIRHFATQVPCAVEPLRAPGRGRGQQRPRYGHLALGPQGEACLAWPSEGFGEDSGMGGVGRNGAQGRQGKGGPMGGLARREGRIQEQPLDRILTLVPGCSDLCHQFWWGSFL